ncbi:sodium- and chloride-dependent GABA transporter 1-like [Frankliniella occidentalis]|uniref:Transporter n=1 Tax=Frankliniella occidentalis TaxID=133901 RepID=A0A9C6UDP1_FRAOC|nr:sodium- and chloride-dependent GABA transporter 1-like [Frankliniella occidentalis]
MSEQMYYWGEEKETVDPDQTFIEFSAKSAPSREVTAADSGGPAGAAAPAAGPAGPGGPGGPHEERPGWGHKLDFLFSCISVSVGLGNVWRFPYLCYKNGGGAFLVTYGIAMVFCGVPIFFQEVAIGQYLGSGGMTLVGQLCPILQGVGYATMTLVFFLDIYYCIIIAWTLYYLITTFIALPELPWSSCDNEWNTPRCYDHRANGTLHAALNGTDHGNRSSPVEEYWDRRVLHITDGIHDLGGMQWELFMCLALGWVLVYFIIYRGLHQSGKIIWFTALFPYAILAVLLVRSVTLEGASDGLLYYVTPRWEELLGPGPWIDGATQIFFAYSIGMGALPTLGSYNAYNHNSYKDALITCVVNTLTSLVAGVVTFSILGHVALGKGTSVASVVTSGPGLVFLTYPEVVLRLPGAPVWSAVFFTMLVVLGIDSEFCIVEALVAGLADQWPVLKTHRKKFTAAMCGLMFLLGLPMVTHGGAYIFQLMDFYSVSGMSLLWVCFFQTIAIGWIFGAKNFSACIKSMMGVEVNKFWYACWVVFAPAVMVAIFVFYVLQYQPLTYGKDYMYPMWAQGIGIAISFSSMVWIPAYAVYYMIKSKGTFKERLLRGLRPDFKCKAKIPAGQKGPVIPMSESSAGLLTKNSSFLNQ